MKGKNWFTNSLKVIYWACALSQTLLYIKGCKDTRHIACRGDRQGNRHNSVINALILVDLEHHGNIEEPISIPDFKKGLHELESV